MNVKPVLSCTLRSLPCSPPHQDSGHTQNPVDSGAPYAVALHDFPAGKDIDNELVEPWDALPKPAFLIAEPMKPDPADIILSINAAFRKGPRTQSCRKAQLESRPLKGMGDPPIQMKSSRCLPAINFNSVMKLLLKITSFGGSG